MRIDSAERRAQRNEPPNDAANLRTIAALVLVSPGAVMLYHAAQGEGLASLVLAGLALLLIAPGLQIIRRA